MDWKRGEVAPPFFAQQRSLLMGWVLLGHLGLGLGMGLGAPGPDGPVLLLGHLGMGLGAPGPDGPVLPVTARNPARLAYGSAALVASLREQHCHFATLPITLNR